ncbi:hypothetical protein BH09ACT12_BH09ACT12_08700 [soil metagenome]
MQHRLLTAVAFVAVAALALSGCAEVRDQMSGASVESESETVGLTPLLETAEWSVTDGLLSVIVRNPGPRTVRSARVMLAAFSSQHARIATVGGDTMLTESSCCTVVSLGPGEEFGLYFAVGDEVGARVSDIELSYSDISYTPGSPTRAAPIIAAAHRTLLNPTRTTVTATLHAGAVAVPLTVVQAVLRGRSGRLIAVVTGRWTCLRAEEDRPIRIELFQPVPAGTTVSTVTARPLTAVPGPTCQSAE